MIGKVARRGNGFARRVAPGGGFAPALCAALALGVLPADALAQAALTPDAGSEASPRLQTPPPNARKAADDAWREEAPDDALRPRREDDWAEPPPPPLVKLAP